jgi:hypothetical protein
MDSPAMPADDSATLDERGPAQAVLAQVDLSWASGQHTRALVVHTAPTMIVLEALDHERSLPPLGTIVEINGHAEPLTGRLAEHGRAGRFLVSVGKRAVRRAPRLKVSLPGTLRSRDLQTSMDIEIADLTTAGARVRGVELPVGSPVTLDFTPPGRTDSVTVRATVAHGTRGASKPWIGVAFHLVAMRGGR